MIQARQKSLGIYKVVTQKLSPSSSSDPRPHPCGGVSGYKVLVYYRKDRTCGRLEKQRHGGPVSLLSLGQVIAQGPGLTPEGERKASEGLRDGKSLL